MPKIALIALVLAVLAQNSKDRLENLSEYESGKNCIKLALEYSKELVKINRQKFETILTCLKSGNPNKRWVSLSVLELVDFGVLMRLDENLAVRFIKAVASASRKDPSGGLRKKAGKLARMWLENIEIKKFTPNIQFPS